MFHEYLGYVDMRLALHSSFYTREYFSVNGKGPFVYDLYIITKELLKLTNNCHMVWQHCLREMPTSIVYQLPHKYCSYCI